MFKELDIENWKRKIHFNFFRDYDNPFFNVCVSLNVTELYKFCRESGISFFVSSLFFSIKAANEIEELRYRIRGDKVIIHDRIHPSSTILSDQDTFLFCNFEYVPDFKEFLAISMEKIEKAKKRKNILDAIPERDDVIHYTSIPWISFTGLGHPRRFKTEDSIPKLSFGKLYHENDDLLIPFHVEVHHSLMDGLHAGNYLKVFQENLDNCREIM